ncbi:hypothetical protein [Aquimarina pacifica]|uniref:hypothetical protein n=1 Tax=Aquimarina pacifica TaxID=1296415 RepID=UPI0004B9C01B|nr:hypothetical protein [Aquimarina pacifica]
MNKCKRCGVYTRSNNPICYECYVSSGSRYVRGFKNYSFEKTPLRYIKGHVAESIIQNLFTSLGFIVFRYGVENNLTYVNEFLDNSDFSKSELSILNSRPDLLILNKEQKKLFFTEIKYRWDGVFKYEDLGKSYKYNNTHIIILSNKGFKCIKAKELKKITIKELNSAKYDLCENKEFNLDKGFVKLMEEQSKNIFSSINEISHISTI